MKVDLLPMDDRAGLLIGMAAWQAAPVISNSEITVSGTNMGSALGYLNLLEDAGNGTPKPSQGLTEISGSRIDVIKLEFNQRDGQHWPDQPHGHGDQPKYDFLHRCGRATGKQLTGWTRFAILSGRHHA